MNSHLMILLIVFIINIIVSVIWLLYNRARDRKSVYMMFAVMIMCPVLGPVLELLSFLFFKFFFSEPVDLDDVIFSKDKIKGVFRAEEERERNLVSIEEAIAVTNETDLRGLMMNVVQGDIGKTLSSISLALNSEDSETAHYAASVLQDALNDFRTNVEKYRQIMRDEPEHRIVAAEAAVDYMDRILKQRVFTDIEQKNYVRVMNDICQVLYDEAPDHMSSSFYEAVSMRLLEIEDYENCEKWCNRASIAFPNTLSSYSCPMKLYFNTGNREKFFEVVEALKQSPVVVDRETLEFIRVFR